MKARRLQPSCNQEGIVRGPALNATGGGIVYLGTFQRDNKTLIFICDILCDIYPT